MADACGDGLSNFLPTFYCTKVSTTPTFNFTELLKNRVHNSTEHNWMPTEDRLSFSPLDLISLMIVLTVTSASLCRLQTEASESMLKLAKKTSGIKVSLSSRKDKEIR